MESLIREILEKLGEDPTREGLISTPSRVEKSLRFLTRGYSEDIDEVLNEALFAVDYDEMVIVRNIELYSLCEHHMLPFFGRCHVGCRSNMCSNCRGNSVPLGRCSRNGSSPLLQSHLESGRLPFC